MPNSYSLGAHFEDLIQRQVRSGRFASASEVVREGLRLIEARDAEREARLEALRTEISRGRDSGPGVPAEEAFSRARARIDEVERTGRRGDCNSRPRRQPTLPISARTSPGAIRSGRGASSTNWRPVAPA
jgi:antitoxin ParD1/3/4